VTNVQINEETADRLIEEARKEAAEEVKMAARHQDRELKELEGS
jgi:vacuolar-type H+-ATPase subunit H